MRAQQRLSRGDPPGLGSRSPEAACIASWRLPILMHGETFLSVAVVVLGLVVGVGMRARSKVELSAEVAQK